MLQGDRLYIAQGNEPCYLMLNQANRHGLICGASGTGKTVTLKQLAQGFSQAGVPVFLADAKGDVTGMCEPGSMNKHIQAAMDAAGMQEFNFAACPCRIWNVSQGAGVPIRITVSQMGPALLSRLLDLSEVQEGVLNIVFRIADDKGLLLIDLKDLRAMLNYVAEGAEEFRTVYGNVSAASVGAIQRALLAVENEGGDAFFGEPELDIADWFACAGDGQGYVNILDATKLINSPRVYAMFLLWMMSELFETLPEVGDPDKPRFVFFFDEAHLLFNDMPKELLDKVVQVVKLIRSKGVGIYFITQSPADIPDEVLAQLPNRIQHALRAYTPGEQKAVRAAAQGFRPNPAFDTEDVICDLATGEALVSCLDEEGRPCVVERARIWASECSMKAASEEALAAVLAGQAELMEKYGTAVDRQSAYEDIRDAQQEANEAALREIGLIDDAPCNDADGSAQDGAAQTEAPAVWFCPDDGTKVEGGRFCPCCGKPAPVIETPAVSTVWFCPQDGTKIEAGSFCPQCGTKKPEGLGGTMGAGTTGAAASAAASGTAKSLGVKADSATQQAIKEAKANKTAQAKQAAAEAKAQAAAAKQAEKEAAAAAKAAEKEKREAEKRAKQGVTVAADVAGAIARAAGVSASTVSAGKSVLKNGSGILRGILGNMK